ncbi:hypothetical protein [Naasia aerilata]|uniref:Uncharacterized protein n=1 Tax=Naasia aerilata TaxID=1162966 RepID=A0ABN6XNC5_9MICO|nr:hypothetical protein [Naasia aerilata]BDZ45140.1 hypothetical protein GCM10025866_10490 [Naasia aerilata]
MTTAPPPAPITTTGEVALPVSSGSMLRMLSEQSEPQHTYAVPRDHAHSSRRDSFRPRRRGEVALLWSATGSLMLASTALVAGVLIR